MSTKKIKIDVVVGADIGKVWNCWSQPQHIMAWNAASDDWHCPKSQNDLRVGGKFTSRMEAKDGSFGFDFEGVYSDVQHHKVISYSMTDAREVTTQFEPLEHGKTKITTVFDVERENPVEMQKDGWQAILNNFKKYVESH